MARNDHGTKHVEGHSKGPHGGGSRGAAVRQSAHMRTGDVKPAKLPATPKMNAGFLRGDGEVKGR